MLKNTGVTKRGFKQISGDLIKSRLIFYANSLGMPDMRKETNLSNFPLCFSLQGDALQYFFTYRYDPLWTVFIKLATFVIMLSHILQEKKESPKVLLFLFAITNAQKIKQLLENGLTAFAEENKEGPWQSSWPSL